MILYERIVWERVQFLCLYETNIIIGRQWKKKKQKSFIQLVRRKVWLWLDVLSEIFLLFIFYNFSSDKTWFIVNSSDNGRTELDDEDTVMSIKQESSTKIESGASIIR